MENNDTVIERYRCCTGGMLGERRLAHAPNGTIWEYTPSGRIVLREPNGTRYETLPFPVVMWLVAPLLAVDRRQVDKLLSGVPDRCECKGTGTTVGPAGFRLCPCRAPKTETVVLVDETEYGR